MCAASRIQRSRGISDFHCHLDIQCSAACPLSKKEAAIKRKVNQLAPGAPISVVRIDSQEEFGRFVSGDQQGFTFYDVDRKAEITLNYAEVRKIKDGYGGYNSAQQRHTDRTKAILIMLVVAGALGGLIGAAAAAKN